MNIYLLFITVTALWVCVNRHADWDLASSIFGLYPFFAGWVILKGAFNDSCIEASYCRYIQEIDLLPNKFQSFYKLKVLVSIHSLPINFSNIWRFWYRSCIIFLCVKWHAQNLWRGEISENRLGTWKSENVITIFYKTMSNINTIFSNCLQKEIQICIFPLLNIYWMERWPYLPLKWKSILPKISG